MKIAILVVGFPPEFVGGTETQTMGIAKHLAKKHDVWVFTKHSGNAKELEERDGFHIVRVKHSQFAPVRYGAYILSIFRKVKTFGPFDIAQCMYLSPNGVAGVMIKHLLRTPVVAWERGRWFYSKGGHFRAISSFVMKNVDRVIVQSEGQKKEIMEMYGTPERRIDAIPNAVDLPKERANGSRLVYLGRLSPVKGPEYLLEALKLMKDPPETLIVGDGPEMEKLQRLAAGLPVEFIGRVEPESTRDWLLKGSFLVLPSLSEGMPNAVLEAMSVGLPVIASRVGSVADIVKDGVTGFLVEPRNTAQLAEKISLLSMDKKLRARMSKAALEEIKNYSWQFLVEKLEKVYEKLTSQRS